MTYASLEEMIVATAEAVRPPERITVSEAAERYHIVKNPGQHEGPFSLDKTPYLREPMDVLTSLDYTGMIFAGPARTGKSAMAINWLCHTAITDPADMMVVHMTQNSARDWSQADLGKALRNSPELKKRLTPGRQNDNVYDKHFLSGMRTLVTWPTISNLSGKTIPRLWLMDLDRMPMDVDKEGNPYDLAAKRAQTFRRYGMCAAEASPGFDVSNPKWIAPHPHDAPPVGDDKGGGILQLYNRGDKRRWYWRCPQCDTPLEPHFRLLQWPENDSDDFMESAEQAHMACPTHGCIIDASQQRSLNRDGRWLKHGQIWLPNGDIEGAGLRRDIASFWMFGPAAGFTDWSLLVRKYLIAKKAYEDTGDESPLRTTTNVDQGDAYVTKAFENGRLPETLKERAEDWGGSINEPVVPMSPGGGFLIATIDVQKRSFVVHVYLVSEGGVYWHVDMFKIRHSPDRTEMGPHGEPVPAAISPTGYETDWLTLIPNVIDRTYPLGDGSGRRMGIKLVACDSGGYAGSTDNATEKAYAFYRYLREEGLHQRFHLLKGDDSRKTAQVFMSPTTWDSFKKDKFSMTRGDVPGWMLSSNFIKDAVSNLLEVPGRVRFPKWAPDWLYSQLTNEIRDPMGKWKNIGNRRNEAWDLLCYCVAFCTHPDVRLQFIDWSNPPSWAADFDHNDFVFGEDGIRAFQEDAAPVLTTAELGALLG